MSSFRDTARKESSALFLGLTLGVGALQLGGCRPVEAEKVDSGALTAARLEEVRFKRIEGVFDVKESVRARRSSDDGFGNSHRIDDYTFYLFRPGAASEPPILTVRESIARVGLVQDIPSLAEGRYHITGTVVREGTDFHLVRVSAVKASSAQ